MKINEQECDEWKQNPGKNPVTGRAISMTGPVYKELKAACEISKKDCEEFLKDPKRHPVTKRKLNLTARNGVFQQLKAICGMKTPVATTALSLSHKRKNLIRVLKKHIAPVLNKADSIENRIKLHRILQTHLKNLKQCIEVKNSKVVISDGDKDVITFDKRIGSDSAYGIAYMNMGLGFARLLKFSCKLMDSYREEHKQEVSILDKLSKIVEKGMFPNFPMTYKVLECYDKCKSKDCPLVAKKNSYYVVINELANSDLENWFKTKHSIEQYESVIAQLVLAIEYYHRLGYVHNDMHLGNALIHAVTPGGYWHYRLGKKDIYVPNNGHLLVLWDFGLSVKNGNSAIDFYRPIALMGHMDKHENYKDLVRMPSQLLKEVVHPIEKIAAESWKLKKKTTASDIFSNVSFSFVKTGGRSQRPSNIINPKPYVIKA